MVWSCEDSFRGIRSAKSLPWRRPAFKQSGQAKWVSRSVCRVSCNIDGEHGRKLPQSLDPTSPVFEIAAGVVIHAAEICPPDTARDDVIPERGAEGDEGAAWLRHAGTPSVEHQAKWVPEFRKPLVCPQRVASASIEVVPSGRNLSACRVWIFEQVDAPEYAAVRPHDLRRQGRGKWVSRSGCAGVRGHAGLLPWDLA